MNIQPGTLLTSSSSLEDANFKQAVIFITEHNKNGAIGFVLNKVFPRTLNELEEFKHCRAVKLYDGGPVDKEHLFFLHRQPDLIEGSRHIGGSVYWGGNLTQAVTHVNDRTLSEEDIKIFVGYCGWDYAQLEEEIEEGSWQIGDASNQIHIFY